MPSYGIFEPRSGSLELYRLDAQKRYHLESANDASRYWLPEMNLFLGTWTGQRENCEGDWLRWWDEDGN